MEGTGPEEEFMPPHKPSNLGVLEKTEVKVQIQLHKALAAPDSGDEDDASFLPLEFFHRAHLECRGRSRDRAGSRGAMGTGPL